MTTNTRAKGKGAQRAAAVVMGAALATALAGCAQGGQANQADGGASKDAEAGSFAAIAAQFDADALDLAYSKRDLDASYDEASAVRIDLAGASAEASGAGVRVEGSQVTVTQEGTYLASGALEGQIVVDAGDEDKVQLVLAGVDVNNPQGPAIFVKNADKCFVTLAADTANALADGADYALAEGEDEPNAALFSKDDLAINGTGSLSVTGSYRHAVNSKDDLVITGGVLAVSAVEDGLRGKDCVKVKDGSFAIEAGGDGLRSSNDSDATRGFVSIDGGSFDIDAGNKGINAETYVRVAGGALNVDAADDALHSNLEGLVSGGQLTISAGDDAFHAETQLVLDGGDVNVTSCVEGYEAERVIVNGGAHGIVASDDALNAAVADLGEGGSSAGGGAARPDAPADADGRGRGAPADAEAPAAKGAPPDARASDGEAARGERGPWEEGDGAAEPGGFAFGGGMPASSDDCLIQVNGGELRLTAGNDAIDSNGHVEFNGGVVCASGPDGGMDGSLDYDKTAKVTGGTLLLLGSVGSTQGLGDSMQPLAIASVSGEAGQEVQFVSPTGDVLASMTAPASFRTVLVSAPSLGEGDACTVVVGGVATSVTVSTAVDETVGFGGGVHGGAGEGAPDGQGRPHDAAEFGGRGERGDRADAGMAERPSGARGDGQEPPALPEGQEGQRPPELANS